jgi:hypothetical protein
VREHVEQLWQDDRSANRFSWYVAIVGTFLTVASVLNLYQVLVWSVGAWAHIKGRPVLRWQLNCADIYVTAWLITLVALLGAGPTALLGLGPVLAIWRVIDILSTNLRILVNDVPRLGWPRLNPRRTLLMNITNAVHLVIAFAVILMALAAQGKHFADLPTTLQPWEAVYRSSTTMFTLGGGLTPLDAQGGYFVVAALASGLVLVAIAIASVVGSIAQTEAMSTVPNQTQSVGGAEIAALAHFVQEVKRAKGQLLDGGEAGSDLDAQVATIEAQMTSPTPHRAVLKAAVSVLVEILKSASGQAAAELTKQVPTSLK